MPQAQVIRLEGGYFNGFTYAVVNFPLTGKRVEDENEIALRRPFIELHHFENPRAKMQGVTILGITQQGPDDVAVVDRYMFSHIQEEEGSVIIWYKLVEPSFRIQVGEG